ncbi:MAG TPA: AAA family ATPase, partial [Candidatus Limnocylindrales bacterium]
MLLIDPDLAAPELGAPAHVAEARGTFLVRRHEHSIRSSGVFVQGQAGIIARRHIHKNGEQLASSVDNLAPRPPGGWGSMASFPRRVDRSVDHSDADQIRGDAPVTQVIAIANQKGGVGKTTTAINLAGALEEEGYRILCIDMDPQANMTAGLGINLNTVDKSMADVLADGRSTLTEVIRPTESAGIDIAPANIDLASTEGELFTALGREQVLRDALETHIGPYDYVLIDCPPNLGLLTVNGLVAANSVIIPVQTQYYAMKGLNNLVKVINMIRMKLNRDLK